ncbi:MAG: hypothetical protein HY654_00735 [Acidobacteria bacterium]|nr:hypothetical protein [Acidobacteriota bacterium]
MLAVEPDSKQSAILKDMARRQLGATLVVVRSMDQALAAINQRLPDLILTSALVQPRDEATLNEYLRGVAGAEHVQTVSIPLLAYPAPKRAHEGPFEPFRRKAGNKKAKAPAGCDPSIFGAEIAAYLKQAADLRELSAAIEETPVDAVPCEAVAPLPIESEAVVATEEESVALDAHPPDVANSSTVVANGPAPGGEAACAQLPPEAGSHEENTWVGSHEERAEAESPEAGIDEPLVEKAPLPLPCLGGVVAPVLPDAVAPPTSQPPVERLELWHALPTLLHVAPVLRGPEIAAIPKVSPVTHARTNESPGYGRQASGSSQVSPEPAFLEPEASSAQPTEICAVRQAEAAPLLPAGAAIAAAVAPMPMPPPVRPNAQPDEWGLYDPSACGFEALFDKLEKLDAVEKVEVTPAKRTKKGPRARPKLTAAKATDLLRTDEPANTEAFPAHSVTEDILRSLRLPPLIAALGRPTGCRVKGIKRKRSRRRGVPGDQRSPEPLIIVSRRALELP